MDYRQAGVDPARASRALKSKASRIASTFTSEVIQNPGGFGGLFALTGYRAPVLCAATDGVGTKLKIAIDMDRHDTVGIDLVAMSVNDLIVQGARPLFFLDYVAAGHLVQTRLEAVLEGVVRGCELAGCALLGGETAEMPGLYSNDDYDLAGFAVGCAERDRLIDGRHIEAGDVLLGLASSGLHANGFSLVRRVIDSAGLTFEDTPPELGGARLGETLLEPTRIYVRAIHALLDDPSLGSVVRGIVHVTGDGIPGNLPRVLPNGLGAEVTEGTWPVPPVFGLIKRRGPVAPDEMRRVFNMGIGLLLVVPAARADAVAAFLHDREEAVYRIGRVTGQTGVRYREAPGASQPLAG